MNKIPLILSTCWTMCKFVGVMLSHDNIYWEAIMAGKYFGIKPKNDVVVSFLPLSHIGGQMQDVWIGLFFMGTVVFADSSALKGTLVETLKEARPTLFFSVPRVYEKMMEGIKDIGKATTGLKKMIAESCKKAGVEFHLNSNDTFMYNIGKKTIYPKVLQALGFDRTRAFWTGAASIGEETLKFFLGFNIVIHDVYGMSETTGLHIGLSGEKPRIGSIGKALPGTEVMFLDTDKEGRGEICMRGRNVMMGYLNREDKTIEDVDEEGWVHSGDLGSIDTESYIYVTGR